MPYMVARIASTTRCSMWFFFDRNCGAKLPRKIY